MTTITDNFTRADADALGSSSEGWSWTEVYGDIDIVSNAVASGADATAQARAEIDLASANQYAQITVTALSAGANYGGLALRYDPAADTCLYFVVRQDALNYRIFKRVAGVGTQLGSTVSEAVPSVPFTIKATVDNANLIRLLINGVSKIALTDSSITGFTRVGIFSGRSAGGDSKQDNFIAGDLAAGSPWYYYAMQGGINV